MADRKVHTMKVTLGLLDDIFQLPDGAHIVAVQTDEVQTMKRIGVVIEGLSLPYRHSGEEVCPIVRSVYTPVVEWSGRSLVVERP